MTIYEKLFDIYGMITFDNSFIESYLLLGPFVGFFVLLLVLLPSLLVLKLSNNTKDKIILLLLNLSYLVSLLSNDFIHASQFIFYYYLNILLIKILIIEEDSSLKI